MVGIEKLQIFMKRKDYIYNVGIMLLAALAILGATSCDDELESSRVSKKDGLFIVDYLPEVGYGTKSIQNGLDKSQRISSLTYLLYWDNKLMKRREIPDIGPTTKWPLRRETMTWGQREALKDTLRQDRTYQVVFVANLDGWEAADGTAVSPLKSEDKYDAAYIELPDSPFENDNMFYLFNTDVSSDFQNADRDKPYNCPVILQRIVTRQDFWGERLPEWKEPTADGEKNPAEEYVHNHSTRLLLQFCFDEKNAFIADAVKGGMTSFWDNLGKDYSKQAVNLGLIDAILNLDSIKKLNDYASQCEEIANNIQTSMYHQTLLSNDTLLSRLDGTLLADCMKNSVLKEQFSKNWQGKNAQFEFKAQTSGANQFYLSTWSSKGTNYTKSVLMPVDTACEIKKRPYDGFSWIGFGRNGATDAEETNQFNILTLSSKDETTTIEIDASECTTGQTGNLLYQAIYTPIDSLLCKDANVAKKDYRFMGDMESIFFGNEADRTPEQKTFIESIKKTLNNPATDDMKKYGHNFTAIPLDVKIPDLSIDKAFTIKPKWTVNPVTK